MQDQSRENREALNKGWAEHNRLLEDFGVAVRDLLALRQQQFWAVVKEDREWTRFDSMIQLAKQKKQRAKYAYLRHVVQFNPLSH